MFASIQSLPPNELYRKAIIFKEAKDYDNYIIHLTMAANLNHSLAIEYLHYDYRNFRTHEKQDYNKTINFYETTLEYGFSANYLAWMFDNGKGVAQDYNKAIELYKIAIEKGNSTAMNNLAYVYESGEGIAVDYDQAINLYQMAIEKGNSGAMFNLGNMYWTGLGIQQNCNKAVELYKLAVEKGHLTAMNDLGCKYLNSRFVSQDYDQAINLFKMAIEKGDSTAAWNLGYIYEEGLGVKQNYELMKQYYLMAINRGQLGAIGTLKSHYMKNLNDLSIVELYDNKYFHNAAKDVINTMFQNNLILPEQYKQRFANLSLDDDIHDTVKTKQDILKKTNIWPSNYDSKYLLLFRELLSVSSSNSKSLTKDVILYIAGCLFV